MIIRFNKSFAGFVLDLGQNMALNFILVIDTKKRQVLMLGINSLNQGLH
jgi:hypothetical protein